MYPYHGLSTMLPQELRPRLFAWAQAAGFEGTEVSYTHVKHDQVSDDEIKELRDQLAEYGLGTAALKPGGYNFTYQENRSERLDLAMRAVEVASMLGSSILNMGMAGRSAGLGALPEDWVVGGQVSVGGSRLASDEEYELMASGLTQVADEAAKHGVSLTLELQHQTYTDTAESMIRMLDMIDRPNVGANPDMGNLVWVYATPHDPMEEAIVKLAPLANYVHMKSPTRLFIPDLNRSIFLRGTLLAQGSVDWRYCLSALADAGYDGWLTFEGNFEAWDFQWAMERNVEYVRSILEYIRANQT